MADFKFDAEDEDGPAVPAAAAAAPVAAEVNGPLSFMAWYIPLPPLLLRYRFGSCVVS